MDTSDDDAPTESNMKDLPLAARLELMSRGYKAAPRAGSSGHKRRRSSSEHEEDPTQDGGDHMAENQGGVTKKKKRKGAPKEMSSKKPVSRMRTVVEPSHKPRSRDPRFDEACGKVNYEMFRKAYGFLDDYQEKEILALKKTLKKEKSHERAEEMKDSLRKAQQERGERRKKDRVISVKQKVKQEERRKVADGKQPFFLKKRDVKRRELEQRFDELSKSGRVEDKLTNKRKTNFGKDLRWMPKNRKVDTA